MEEPVAYSPWGRKESDTTERLHPLTHSRKDSLSYCPAPTCTPSSVFQTGLGGDQSGGGFPGGSAVKNLPSMLETWVRSLGWDDPLKKEIAVHSSVLPWRIPRMVESGGLPSMELHRVRHDCSDSAAATASILKNWNSDRLYFLGLQNHCRWWLQPWN